MNLLGSGEEVAGYRIEALLGRGGMAVVYRAEDTRLGRKVALKLLSPDLVESEQFRARFIRESRLAASLDHPNIIPIYEAGESAGLLFIAMRLVIGSDLKAVVAGHALEPSRALNLISQVCNALDVAHAQGLVHRDVKPGNILISPGSDGSEHVYLTDFGLTKRTSSLSGALTRTGNFLGTIDYVAPEQIAAKTVDPRTDIYALGCVIYECLTGQLPFHRDDDAALLWAHLAETPPSVDVLRPELGQQVGAVVSRAMAKAPENRYASCHDLLVDLRRAMDLPESLPLAHRHGELSSNQQLVSPDRPSSAPPPAAAAPSGFDHPSFPPGSYDPAAAPPLPADDVTQEPWDEDAASYAEPEAPAAGVTKRPARWLWPVVALVLVLALGGAAAAFFLRGSGVSLSNVQERNQRVPMSFHYPGDWADQTEGIQVVKSPVASAAGPLFIGGGGGSSWSAVTDLVAQRPGDVVGLYTFLQQTPVGGPDLENYQQALSSLMPPSTEYSAKQTTVVAGREATLLTGDVSDPNSDTVLRVATYVIENAPRTGGGFVQLTFFALPGSFAGEQKTFDAILDTVSFE